ncbi:peptide ABC transporter substrate-binding protein [Gulosibacter sediminis]|uniref:peptide ABC transporter substrate-binding protein n=1 Tax=Gulosibacter sediminis TaxID=1729695 RepID=UPI0024A80BC7|nr:ABC transporter substrate-binding protein [Gulosibacter sediminis]
MSRRSRLLRGSVALAAAGALLLAGCTSGNAGDGATEGASGDSAAIITTNGSEPQSPLITYATTETGGGKILTAMYAGLVSYDAAGETQNEMAESIESDDAIHWTIKIKPDWTFTNGETITAQTYVDTWMHAAKDPSGAYWFGNFEGSSDDGSTDLTGIEAVDDTTFTVTLKEPEADFAMRLGYTAYMPLPSVAFEDIEAFGENPIGNGPYMPEGEGAWRHDEGMTLVTNPDYEGNRTPANGGVEFIFYTGLEAAYADAQGGNLDLLDTVPDANFSTYETDFPDRNINQAAAIYQGFNIPFYIEHFGNDEEGKLRRAAISMAVNREEITETIFQGTRTPAVDFTSPVVEGFNEELEGNEVLTYDPEKAQELWAEADAISPYEGTFTISYNADGGHQAWVDATANSISNTLGITAEGKSYPSFAAALEDRENQKLDGATRAGWQGDYPSQGNFLSGQYQTGASSNYEGYSNPEFDELVTEALSAPTTEEAVELYTQAQQILLEDLPSIPLWYSNAVGVWGESVSNVTFGWDSVPMYHEITKG